MPARRILVVDDDATLQAMFKLVLGKAGYQVIAALDGNQGTMMARTMKPDLIILDMMMPAGGGQSVFERVRQMSGTMTIPVLVHSAMPMDQVLAHIQPAPDVHILPKPAEPQALLEAVRKSLGEA